MARKLYASLHAHTSLRRQVTATKGEASLHRSIDARTNSVRDALLPRREIVAPNLGLRAPLRKVLAPGLRCPVGRKLLQESPFRVTDVTKVVHRERHKLCARVSELNLRAA